jgi:hypothetical protein
MNKNFPTQEQVKEFMLSRYKFYFDPNLHIFDDYSPEFIKRLDIPDSTITFIIRNQLISFIIESIDNANFLQRTSNYSPEDRKNFIYTLLNDHLFLPSIISTAKLLAEKADDAFLTFYFNMLVLQNKMAAEFFNSPDNCPIIDLVTAEYQKGIEEIYQKFCS